MSSTAADVEQRYDLGGLKELILKHAFKTIVLQFPDEELQYSFSVYEILAGALPDGCDIFVTADSTWGSSIDDVSAMHCDGDILIYFGSDLSSSGTIPVIICPPRNPISVEGCLGSVNTALSAHTSDPVTRKVAVFYEPGYAEPCKAICASIGSNAILAKLPNHADLTNWAPRLGGKTASTTGSTEEELIVVGGLLIPASVVSDKETVIVYVGDKPEQIVNILLRASEHTVLHYTPSDPTAPVRVLKGTDSREFRERYGGVLRVKDAKIVGIIVGSMGLTADLTRDIMHRLQTLIRAARKKYYCFVMGRLNEAKLCNFPEVDIFCLVSNEDNANIKPKTFHKPVVTPFELELGLGAREWGSSFCTDLGALVGNGEEDLRAAVERVREENPGDGCDSDEEDEGSMWTAQRSETAPEEVDGSSAATASCSGEKQGGGEGCACTSTAVVEHGVLGGATGGKGQLTVFHSAAAEYLQNREYKGLERAVAADAEMGIVQGQYGVAAGYRVHDVPSSTEDK